MGECRNCESDFCGCEPHERLGLTSAEGAELWGNWAVQDVARGHVHSAIANAEIAWHCATDADCDDETAREQHIRQDFTWRSPLTRFIAEAVGAEQYWRTAVR